MEVQFAFVIPINGRQMRTAKCGRYFMSDRFRVGWVGIGKMGAPMSRHALRAGYPLTVFDPLPENRATIVAEGATVAYTFEELAAASDVIILTIPNDAVLNELVFSAGGLAEVMTSGQTLVEMSTVSPEISASIATALEKKSVNYLRAPISGSTTTASAGKLSVMASGPKPSYAKLEPLFSSFANRSFYLGEGEESRYLKLVLNALVGATAALLGEALTLGRKGNLSMETMLEVICESAVASPLIAYKRDLLVNRNFDPAFSVSQMMKDFDLILGAAKTDHVPMFLTSIIRQQYESAFAEGLAEKDFFVLIEQYERLAGLEAPISDATPMPKSNRKSA
jgi:3-hydroxyisobutyrate dehydrogenase-like beta-hydroxyacid dehydrogenase